MNTARLTARVGWYGTYWTVQVGDNTTICKNVRQLVKALTGRQPEQEFLPPPEPYTETVEEFLARGGKIKRVSFPTSPAPLPPAVSIPLQKAPSRITLESLGLVFRPRPAEVASLEPTQASAAPSGIETLSNSSVPDPSQLGQISGAETLSSPPT